MPINLRGRVPAFVGAMSSRIVYIGVGVGLLMLAAVIYGFHYRIERKRQMMQSLSSKVVAQDAGTSNREAVHPSTGEEIPKPRVNLAKPIQVSTSPVSQPVEMTAVQRMRDTLAARDMERRHAAMEAPTGFGHPSANTANPQNQTQAMNRPVTPPPMTPGANTLPPVAPQMARAVGGSGPDFDPNRQDEKRDFQKPDTTGDYLHTTRVPPISPYVLERGDSIPAGSPSQIVSDLPGDITAEVIRDVYDSPTHSCLLIPAGSLLAGDYNSSVTYGQSRIQAIWSYLRFPDGTYVNLDKFASHSADGSSGLKDQTDNHIKRLVGGIALTSAFAAGIQISQNRSGSNSTLAYPSNTQLAASAAGQQAAQMGERLTNRNLSIQPTIKIRPGYDFAISVMKAIVFPGCYKAINLVGK
jgi:type IV secretion system protein TrbI